jgi:hypothetical protein
MAIWDFDMFETDDLERLCEIQGELEEMGLNILDEDMMGEVAAELSRRTAFDMLDTDAADDDDD